MFLQCACIVHRWVHAGYILNVWFVLRYILSACQNEPCTQHLPTSAYCRHIAGTSVNHNSTVIGNHIAGTCWGYILNVKEMLLLITLDANVEVILKCEWNVSGRNIGGTFCQSLKCSQRVNTCFHRPSPPVSCSWHWKKKQKTFQWREERVEVGRMSIG